MPRAAQPPSNDPKEHAQSQVVAFPRSPEEELHPSHHNLPLELTSFVGREREISEVKTSLLADNRLLTLTGPGSCGKTRLALALARELAGAYQDGAWLVELAPLSDPELVERTVAGALGVREQPGRPLTATLMDHLHSKKLLLVMDNCEHLVEAAAELVGTLLGSCLSLKILATSREALNVAGELLWPVPSLSAPKEKEDSSLAAEELARYESVRLFVERARYRRPSFELTPENVLAVAEVCRRLEGIPLAIELAAARVGVLSVGQIAARLKDSLGVLATGSRTAEPRQRTLRGTLDWSYGLLGELERDLFGRLSVFAGSWELEAAEAVGISEGIKEEDVLDLLSGLVNKSLVVAEADGVDSSRYRMLEPVRQYARDKLEESGETEEVRHRHATWFLGLAEEAMPHLKGHRQVAWLGRLEREHDNLRAAMRWLLEEGEVETAVRLAWALRFFWYVHGHQSEGYRYTAETLQKGSVLPTSVRAKALCVGGLTSYGLESIDRTQQLWEESAALFRQTEDRFGRAVSLAGVGLMTLQQGDMERASALLEEALELYREMGDKWGVSSILSHLGSYP